MTSASAVRYSLISVLTSAAESRGRSLGERASSIDGLGHELVRFVAAAELSAAGQPARQAQQRLDVGGDRTRLHEEPEDLVLRTERARRIVARSASLAWIATASPSPIRSGLRRRKVVGRYARQLVVAERHPRRRQMSRTAIAPGQGPVGDLADEALDEDVLARSAIVDPHPGA